MRSTTSRLVGGVGRVDARSWLLGLATARPGGRGAVLGGFPSASCKWKCGNVEMWKLPCVQRKGELT